MKTSLIILLLLLSQQTFANEYRVFKYGAPCEGLIKNEEQLGGVSTPKYNDDTSYSFSATYMGREASIIYRCDENNSLIEITQFIRFSNLGDAINFFKVIKTHLLQQYGAPTLDASTEIAEKVFSDVGIELGELDKLSVYWKREIEDLYLNLINSNSGKNIAVGVGLKGK